FTGSAGLSFAACWAIAGLNDKFIAERSTPASTSLIRDNVNTVVCTALKRWPTGLGYDQFNRHIALLS
ncbi:MAG: hypothetical protein AAGD43_33410, partial [Pseudomonadota bacterium]